MSASDQIVARAIALGFASAGIARVSGAETIGIYRDWLSAGCAAGMRYLEARTHLREDPRLLLPGARSVLMTGTRYPSNPEPGRGISSYALGADYHETVKSRLEQLLEAVRGLVAVANWRIVVDSAPVLEREWALRAGVGWRGKNGMVVNAEAGSCMFLGGILLEADLEPTGPAAGDCGDCRACLDACPTGALGANGLVDARRCISYLTVEHKGEFTPEQARMVGETLFGCDMCTSVCPLNRHATAPVDGAGQVIDRPGVSDVLAMDEVLFDARFGGTPVRRAGLRGLRRNALAALSNAEGSVSLPCHDPTKKT